MAASYESRLTIIRADGHDNHGHRMSLCACKCGNTVRVQTYRITTGATKSCGCIQKEWAAQIGRSKSKGPGVSAKNCAFKAYQYTAKCKGIPFHLSRDQFIAITQQPCYYCGSPPNNCHKRRSGAYTYSGIDRVNSDKGYEGDNVVPCCRTCNSAKRDMPVHEFVAWIVSAFKTISAKPTLLSTISEKSDYIYPIAY